LQEHETNSKVKTSTLKCCSAKSAAQIPTQSSHCGSQMSADLSGVLASPFMCSVGTERVEVFRQTENSRQTICKQN